MREAAVIILLMFTIHGIKCFLDSCFALYDRYKVKRLAASGKELGRLTKVEVRNGRPVASFELSEHGMAVLASHGEVRATFVLSLGGPIRLSGGENGDANGNG